MSANRDNVDRICVSSVGCGSLLRSHTYAYDGWNLILEQIAHAGGSTDVIEYFWGYDLSGSEQGAGGVGGLVALAINGAFYFPCYDQNGNVTEYVDESGSIAAQFAYDAFGNLLTTENSQLATLLSFRFSTKYLDPETGFYYYGYRYYDPNLGRWLTRDPIEAQGGLNLYGFCGKDAVNRWDKLGLSVSRNSPGSAIKGCCIKGQYYVDEKIKTGVVKHFFLQTTGGYPHSWITIDDSWSAGFYPNSSGSFFASFGQAGDVHPSDSPVSATSYEIHTDVMLSPCSYDFDKIKEAIKEFALQKYGWYFFGIRDCLSWSNAAIKYGLSKGKR